MPATFLPRQDTDLRHLIEETAPDPDDILYIQTTPDTAPTNKHVHISNLISMEFAQIYTAGGAGTQTPGTSYALIDQWATDGLSSGGLTADATNGVITITTSGVYYVSFQLSFTGTTGSLIQAAVFWGDVEQPQIGFQRKIGTGSDVGSASSVGLVDATTGSTDFDLRVKCDGATDDFGLVEGQLSIFRVGA